MINTSAFSIQVVLASGREEDRESLERILAGSAWHLISTTTAAQAVRALRAGKSPMLLCDPFIVGRDWKKIRRNLWAFGRRISLVPLLDHDDRSLDSNLAADAFDFLTRPLEPNQVFRALFFAYARWKIEWPVGVLTRATKWEFAPRTNGAL